MKTRDLLLLSVDRLVDSIEAMSVKECEKHARKIVKKYNGPEYAKTVQAVVDAVVDYRKEDDLSVVVYRSVMQHFPHHDKEDDALGRLSLLVLMVVYKRTDSFKRIRKISESILQNQKILHQSC